MNKVILCGRFTKDPESRMTQNSIEVSRFSLACKEGVDKEGNPLVEFINCIAFNKLANTINRYCKKGGLVLVEGKIKNSSYDNNDGVKKYITNVNVSHIEFCSNSNETKSEEKVTTINEKDSYQNFGDELTLTPDDLPF